MIEPLKLELWVKVPRKYTGDNAIQQCTDIADWGHDLHKIIYFFRSSSPEHRQFNLEITEKCNLIGTLINFVILINLGNF